MKSIFSLFILLLLSISNLSAESFIVGDINYQVTSAVQPFTVEVIPKTSGYVGDIVIPEKVTYNGIEYFVTSIGVSAFYDDSLLTSVIIPNTIVEIKRGVFSKCTRLTSVNIPNSVKKIPEIAFNECSGLVSVTLPNTIDTIGYNAFYKCISLESITIPSSVTRIGYWAFADCKALKSIILPNSLKKIESATFSYCSNLSSAQLGKSLEIIAENAFTNCISLTSVSIPDRVTEIKDNAFSDCWELESVLLGNSISTIGNYAFARCYKLTNVVIPDSVQTIGDYAFSSDSSMISIDFSRSVKRIGKGALYKCKGLQLVTCRALFSPIASDFAIDTLPNAIPLYVPLESLNDYKFEWSWSRFIITPLPAGYDFIVDSIAYKVTSETAPYTVEVAGKYPSYYSGDIIIPGQVLHVGKTYSVTAIGRGAFSTCLDLKSVVIPNSVQIIKEFSFSEDSGLVSITLPESLKNIKYLSFRNCKNLTSINLPNSVTEIGSGAFIGCSGLTSLILPDLLTNISDSLLWNCSGLTSLNLPENVMGVGRYPFIKCKNLESIKVDVNNGFYTSIDGVLYNKDTTSLIICPNKKASVTIPNTVIDISDFAFYYCKDIDSVVFPKSVKTIGDYIFLKCPSLRAITSFAVEPPVFPLDINLYAQRPIIYVPAASVNMYKELHSWTYFTIKALPSGSNFVINNIAYKIISSSDPLKVEVVNKETLYTGDIVIPNQIIYNSKNYSVSAIGENAFAYCIGLKSVILPETITEIKYAAFLGCTKLTAITIPNSVIKVGNEAFSNCTTLVSVTIPKSVIDIGSGPFLKCKNLKSINVDPDNQQYVSIDGILYNKSITTLIKCPDNKSYVTIPNSVTTIGYNAFRNCDLLTSITIPNSVRNIEAYAFMNCLKIEAIHIPNSITKIGPYAFNGCMGALSFTIPNSVKSIERYALGSLYGLESMVSYALTPPALNYNVFNYLQKPKILYVPAVSVEEYKMADQWRDFTIIPFKNLDFELDGIHYATESLNEPYEVKITKKEPLYNGSIIIPDSILYNGNYFSVNKLADSAFYNCSGINALYSLKNIPQVLETGVFENVPKTIPLFVPAVAENNYKTTEGWKDFEINPVKVDFIREGIAYRITSSDEPFIVEVTHTLTDNYKGNIVIPEKVSYEGEEYTIKSIGDYTFFNCKDLISVTLPISVDTIGKKAFKLCSGLTKITCYNQIPPSLGTEAFDEEANTITLKIPPESIDKYKATEAWNDLKVSAIYIDFMYNNIHYAVTSLSGPYKVKVISKLGGYSGNHVIPEQAIYNGLNFQVTEIGDSAFLSCSILKTIVLPGSITSIGDHSFSYCRELLSVEINGSLLHVGDYAFSNCTKLTSITLPNTTKTIGYSAFNWSGLTSIIIPDSVTRIEPKTFYYCSYLKSVTLPESIKSIGVEAFSNTGITSIILPDSITSIESRTFYSCFSLNSITLPSNVKSIGSEAFNHNSFTTIKLPETVTSIGNGAFYYCYNLESVTIPNSVKTVENQAFSYCGKLQKVEIPNSVSIIGEEAFSNCWELSSLLLPKSVASIGKRAFRNCRNLKTITCLANIPPEMDSLVFEYVPITIPLYVNRNIENLYKEAEQWQDFMVYGLPASIDFIEDGIAYNIVSETLPYKVQVIQNTSKYLGDIVIPEQVTHDSLNYTVVDIADKVFYDSPDLRSVSLPNTIKTIKPQSFYMCPKLSTVIIPNSVTNIGREAFMYSGLASIQLPNTIHEIDTLTFGNCVKLISITIPNSVKSINEVAFGGCWNLKTIVLSDSLINIGVQAFWYCTSLDSIQLPNTLKYIGFMAFTGDSSLTSIEIPNSVSHIDNTVFELCTKLKTVTLPETISTIGFALFEDCSSLSSISIPKKVTNIETSAFEGCIGLKSITCNAVVPPTLGFVVFREVPKNILLYVPAQSVDAYKNADQWKDFIVTPLPAVGNFSAEDLVFTVQSKEIPYTVKVVSKKPQYYMGDIVIPEQVIYDGVTYQVTAIGDSAFFNCVDLISIEIPATVASIGEYAFGNCTSLTSVTLGSEQLRLKISTAYDKNLKNTLASDATLTIGNYAFYNCISLTSVTCNYTIPPALGSEVFSGVPENASLWVPEESENDYKTAQQWKEFFINSKTNIDTDFNSEFLVYPNPVNNYLNIEGLKSGSIVFVYDMHGNKVLSAKTQNNVENIDFSRLPEGVYLIKVNKGDHVIIIKE